MHFLRNRFFKMSLYDEFYIKEMRKALSGKLKKKLNSKDSFDNGVF